MTTNPRVGPIRLLVRRARFWASVAWRPVHGDPGQSWLGAWWKYRLGIKTAWELACRVEDERGPVRWDR